MSRTIFNELGENRVINPRSGFSQFVDLSNNQQISGIKRFLNNLITNSDVNFNTTANLGRIVFNPNEPAGSGSQIVSIYTTDEIDGNSWIFDSAGNFYYLGTSPNPAKIIFSPSGNITSLGNLECQQITAKSTLNTFGDVNFFTTGSKRFIFNPTQSSPSSYPILSIFTVNEPDGKGWFFDANGYLYYNGVAPNPKILFEPSGDITASSSVSTNLIKASTYIFYRPAIYFDNRFLNAYSSSLDIVATRIGFAEPTQVLTTASKYMYIKPGSDGNFEIKISNISNIILSSDWATSTINSQYIWNFNTTTGTKRFIFNPTQSSPSTNPILSIYTVSDVDGKGWFFNANGELYYNGVAPNPKILFEPSGNITSKLLKSSTSGTLGTNIIQLDNRFFDISNGSVDIKATYTGFPYITDTLSTTSKYMAIKPLSTGNFQIEINNIVKKIMISDWATTAIKSSFVWKWLDISGFSIVEIDGYSGVPFEVHTDPLHLGPALRFNTGGTLGLYAASTSLYRWTIDINGAAVFGSVNTGSGTITSTTINATTINATGSLKTNTIEPYTSTIIDIKTTSNFSWLKSVGVYRIKFYPSSTSGDIMQFFTVGDTSASSGYLSLHNTGDFGYTATTSQWKFNASGDLTCKSLTLPNASISSAGLIAGTSLNVGSGSISGWAITGTSLTVGTTNSIIAGTTNSNTFQANNINTYLNKIEMSNEYANPDIGEIDMISQYIAFAHPSNALSASAKYGFLRTYTGGDTTFNINNISGYIWGTDWGNRLFYTDFTFQCQKDGFTAAYKYQKFTNSGTQIGSIGMLTSSTIQFSTSSDYRLKQDIIPIQNPLERLLKLKPKNYRFIADVKDESCCDCYFDGFLAHEVSDVVPMAVSGVKDDPDNFQQLDYSKFTPLLTGAVQELNEKVEKQQIIIDSLIKRLEMLENK